jgi:DNA-binding SARP family transcriptional activator/WD40 repeat protein
LGKRAYVQTVRFAVIGQLAVLRDDLAPVAVPGAKERLLLAVLASAAPDVVSTDRLLDTVWDGAPPPTARKSLQAHVVRLRNALEPDRPKGSSGRYVLRRGAGYALAVDRPAIDALHIGDLAARGRAQLASGDPTTAMRQLSSALDLWRGEPYADWPDAPFASAERRRLAEVRAGALAGRLEAQIALGRHADVVPELVRLVTDEPLREGWWSLLMLALYRDGRQAEALGAGRRVRALLAEELGADPGPALRAVETAILTQDPALELPAQRGGRDRSPPRSGSLADVMPASGSCPYKGLAAYQVEDAALFYGRRRIVASLVQRLVDSAVLVVSGPSGAGKSSVVRAGLVPALTAGALSGSSTWQSVILSPGPSPVDALAKLTGESPPLVPVLLICDQFEELFAYGIERAERVAFLDTVLGLIDDGIVVRFVAVLRGDHVGRLAEHAEFTARLDTALVLVPALTDPELREVVAEPARSVGLSVEPELLDAVVADVLGQAGALPLLSIALVGTWERRRGDLLTLAGYLEAGGVAGALTRSAEAVYAGLGIDDQEVARALLVRLADTDDGGAIVRRAVPVTELDLDGEGGAARRAVVEAFVGRRLLSVDGDRLEVAHEAMLTAWPRLARWLEDDAVGRTVRRHLAPAALEWDHGGQPIDELYRGARLSAALDWAHGHDADVTPVEQQFLDASRAMADADLRAAHERAEREAERAEREAGSRRRTRRLAAGLAGVLVLALLASGLAFRYQRDADARARDADANRLAALSTTAGTVDVSLLLAAQAMRLGKTPETEDALLAALVAHPRVVRAVQYSGGPEWALLGGAGHSLFLGTLQHVGAWSVGPTTQPREIVSTGTMERWGGARGFAVSPTENLLAMVGETDPGKEPWVRVVTADGSPRLTLTGTVIGGSPTDVAFSSDGQRVRVIVATPHGWQLREVDLASQSIRSTGVAGVSNSPRSAFGGDGKTVVLWTETGTTATLVDLEGRHREVALQRDRRPASSTFLPLSTGAAELWGDGTVTLYGRDGKKSQLLDWHQAPVRDVAVSPDGTWAVTAGDGGAVARWDIDTSTALWSQQESLTGHQGDVSAVEIDPTGRLLFTVSGDGAVVEWDMRVDGGFGRSYPVFSDRWVAAPPAVIEPGRLLVAATRPIQHLPGNRAPNFDATSVAATFLDPSDGTVVAQIDVGDSSAPFTSVAVSRDRREVAVTTTAATKVFDAANRRVRRTIVLPPWGPPDETSGGEPRSWLVWASGWAPDGSLLLGVGGGTGAADDPGFIVVDPSTGTATREVSLRGGSARTMELSPDGRLLVVGNAYGPEVYVLDAATYTIKRTLSLDPADWPADLSFSRDGQRLAVGSTLGLLHVFDTSTWRRLHKPAQVHDSDLLQVGWLGAGRTVVTTGSDGKVSLFDATRGLVRGRALPASTQGGAGATYLLSGTSREVVAVTAAQAGRRYPMKPSAWLAEACAVAGRNLSRAEWSRYLPDRTYERTCSRLP